MWKVPKDASHRELCDGYGRNPSVGPVGVSPSACSERERIHGSAGGIVEVAKQVVPLSRSAHHTLRRTAASARVYQREQVLACR